MSFETPQRQSMLGILVYLAKNGRAFLSAAVILWVASDSAPLQRALIFGGILLVVILVLVISYLQYRNFTFYIKNNELIVNSGVIFKEQQIIPFERIQSVHTQQNIVQQLLNLTGLKVDSAGSRGKELEIPALDRETAEALQQFLQEKKEQTVTKPEFTSVEDNLEPVKKELLKLDIFDLLKVGITENHLKTGLLAVAFVYGYYSQYSSYLDDYIDTEVENYLPEVMRLGMILVIAGAMIFLVVSTALSMIKSVLKYFDFHAWLENNVIAINSGLLKRNQYRIPLKKVQYLIWQSNPLRKLLKFETVVIKQAQSADTRRKETISIPACRRSHSEALENLMFERVITEGKRDLSSDIWAYLRISTMVTAFLVAIVLVGVYLVQSIIVYPVLAVFPIIWFFTYKYATSIGVEIREDLVIINKGWIFPDRIIFPYHKAQSVQLSQSVFMRPRHLAHLKVFTAAGSITIRYLKEKEVRQLYDYCLYRIETFRGSWM